MKLFDIYEGDQIKAGFKSVAYTLTFRNLEKTLSDDEVKDRIMLIREKYETTADFIQKYEEATE